ncbi:MAG: hypothetical protein JRD89_09575 [Deltaproteobacteria bacterium]|nr:hypothetical protein [Deltaproteobacteria bacterium]
MLQGKKYASQLADLRESKPPCPYPIFHLSHGEICLGGLFDDANSKDPFSPKRFELHRQDGVTIAIPDLLSMHLLFPHPGGYFDGYSQKYILEPQEAEDLFVFAIRAKAECRHDPNYYRMLQPATFFPQDEIGQGRVDADTDEGHAAATEMFALALYEKVIEAQKVQPGFGQEMLAEHYYPDGAPKLDTNGRSTMRKTVALGWLMRAEKVPNLDCEYRSIDAELFQLAIFHNQELVHEIDDVFRGFRIGRNVQAVYAKANPAYQGSYLAVPGDATRMSEEERTGEPPYVYWLFADGDSSMIGSGWDRDPMFISTERESAIYGVGLQLASVTPILSTDCTHVTLRYHFEPTAMFEMLHQYASEHGQVSLCDNLFDDDTSRNYIAEMSTADQDAIAFVEFIFNHCQSLAGEALYWADLDDYYCGTTCLDTRLRLLNASPKTREAHRRLLRLLYQKCGEPYDERRVPAKASEHVTSGARHIQAVRQYVEAEHPTISLGDRWRRALDVDPEAIVKADSYFKQRAVEFEKRKAKAKASFGGSAWKSERILFEMVQSYYPDTVYQYRADWLGQKSLDMFIPSARIAFEYQGRQHYKSVEHFGGDAALKDAERRDASKAQACESEGIRLVEWPYWVPLSALTLFDMLR